MQNTTATGNTLNFYFFDSVNDLGEKYGLTFYVNSLLADDSHEISSDVLESAKFGGTNKG